MPHVTPKHRYFVEIYNYNEEKVTAEVILTPGDEKKIAEVVLHFDGGFFADWKLSGFSVWRKVDGSWSVTFPQQTWMERGERRRFTFLRPEEERKRDAWGVLEQEILRATVKASEEWQKETTS